MASFSTLKFITSFVLLFSLIACSENDPKKIVIEKTVIKDVDSVAIVNENPEMAKLQKEVLGLSNETQVEKQTIVKLNTQVKTLRKDQDSLRTLLNQKDNVIKQLAVSKQHEISEDELQIRALVQYLNKAWMSLPGAGTSDYFLDLFSPEFTVSMLSIGMDDDGIVKTMNKDEFKKMLDGVRKRDDFTIQIGNVDYVYFNGRKDLYSIVYTAILRSYQNEVPVNDKSFVATVTVKRLDGKWKIGKYSWTSMGHDLQ